MKVKDWTKQWLIGKQNKRYEREVCRQYETYDTWIRRVESEGLKSIPMFSESVLSKEESLEAAAEDAEYVLMPSLSGCFIPEADRELRDYFAKHPQCMIVYGDEDILEEGTGRRSSPWFKPEWSPDTFLSFDYLGNVAAIRKSFFSACGYTEAKIAWKDRKQVLKSCMEKCGGFQPGCQAIRHLGQILFHGYSQDSQRAYLEAYREETDGFVSAGSISVIIPSKDNVSVLKQCMASVIHTAGREDLEFVLVDNGSCQETVENIKKLIDDFSEYRIKYIYQPMDFNFSRMCNLGAKSAAGDFLLFLNDDTQAVAKGWLESMADKAAQPYVGAAGIKLLYPENRRIQHAGVVNLPMGPVHKLQFLSDDREYYFGKNRMIQNVLAVTAACLMVKRERFFQAGGFCEELKVAFNDVDLCFKLYEAGYHNVIINTSFLYHHESLSRGNDETFEKWKRLMQERDKLYQMHPGLRGRDPYYSAFLNRNGLDTRILPGNEDSRGNEAQATVKRLVQEPGYSRKDECLLLRIERAEGRCIQGYAVVLGSNNACYEKKLILKSEETEGKVYGYETVLPPVYRSDLKENMPDQENVALCGFRICLQGKILPGSYRIGIIARDRISGQKILNFSSRIIRLT